MESTDCIGGPVTLAGLMKLPVTGRVKFVFKSLGWCLLRKETRPLTSLTMSVLWEPKSA